ncbi:MAG: ATP-binding cassette domain-containing protein [Lentisphaerae bacterium]|jgi:molybdate/tungstate transport system ATP-binding protein|nr:ATP-binding cassette domain-containing protein [Lentisphaerota bacterium]MBT4821463.1 ATP-binding cassette domain-containing protein [Lentisphaerota bacterium]MBT5604371.1 ATP-binding cassette domain-containing protein [Lentisphaerota bacterium]MBT7055228.1 ATP-binding cassette domain-containing protein [Lentisphaerota bacterium]MBT7843261.1 ATP-binding cassette domain-containing protein [Lentisphaerota bacterium]
MIEVKDLCVRAGTFALEDISFRIPSGTYGVLMGRTACGKTSVLEAICGLRRPAAGRILLDGKDVTRVKAADRGIGYVPQDAALFTTMTIRNQLGFALTVRGWDQEAIDSRAEELAEQLAVGHLLERYPQGLSGGERQRVALGRALAFHPTILCLDEPLSSLDEETRGDMCELLRRVAAESHVTTLHITHSPTEARELADTLLRIQDGRLISEHAGQTNQAPEGPDV